MRGRDLGIRWGSMVLPSFHTMGISIQLLNPLTSGNAIGVYTPMAPNLPVVPNPENFLEAMRVTECTGTLTVPSIIEVCAPRLVYAQIPANEKSNSLGPKIQSM